MLPTFAPLYVQTFKRTAKLCAFQNDVLTSLEDLQLISSLNLFPFSSRISNAAFLRDIHETKALTMTRRLSSMPPL
ncbi:hypothetical protein GCK32_014678 [Trichostrongylus colubriformis]|uniref:Uncharacterized protein n=1 Tax=Trichostrongylus colubriformis TaxID=6319 RepID=A0AAN8IM82_TRICO